MQLFDINSKINAKNIFYKIFYNEANEDFDILIFFYYKKTSILWHIYAFHGQVQYHVQEFQ